MTTMLPFTKMHGIGNDYVYVDGFAHTVDDPAGLSRRISDRHTGIGSDGLILPGVARLGSIIVPPGRRLGSAELPARHRSDRSIQLIRIVPDDQWQTVAITEPAASDHDDVVDLSDTQQAPGA